jgi:hypothetical protein
MNRTLAPVLLAAAAACTFNYKNPAEDLAAGVVGGRAVVSAVPKPGVAVSVKGSTLAQGTRQTGLFLMLPLPAGNHTLLLRSGSGALVARDVEVRYGRDGQPEGVWLGDVPVPGERTATIQGSVDGNSPGGCGFLNGLVVDETSGLTFDFQYSLFTIDGLPLGDHRLTFAAFDSDCVSSGSWMVGGPVTVTISSADAGTLKTLVPFTLHAPATPDITGRIKVRLAGIGMSAEGYSIAVSPDPGNATPDSTGLIDASVPEGMYTLTVWGPAGAVVLPPPTSAVVTAGEVTDVGTLYVTSLGAQDAVTFACSTDADCAPGICMNRTCTAAYTPPAVAPSGFQFCGQALYQDCATLGTPCGPTYASPKQYCMDAGSGLMACLPVGSCCTVDGTALVCGAAPLP